MRARILERPFVRYVGNQAQEAHRHFHGLREAKADLVGYALFDRLESLPPGDYPSLAVHCWRRREIENYLTSREILLTWAREAGTEREGPLFGAAWEVAMESAIGEIETALTTLGESPWSDDTKATDRFLDPLFANFFDRLGLPTLLRKTDYHELARYVSPDTLDGEVREVLDAIHAAAQRARPRE